MKNPNLVLFVGAGFILTLIVWGFVGGCGVNKTSIKTQSPVNNVENINNDSKTNSSNINKSDDLESSAEGLILDKSSILIENKPQSKAENAQTESVDNIYYIVEPGDTLWRISKKFNVSVDKIKMINNLRDDSISVGQKLLISGKNLSKKEISDEQFLEKKPVNKNSTISKKQESQLPKKDSAENIKVNEMQKTLTSVQEVPVNTQVSNIKMTNNNETKLQAKPGTVVYKVRPNDSLWRIAQVNETSVDKIIQLNNLTKNSKLTPGQEILVPVN